MNCNNTHVYPLDEEHLHTLEGEDCICHPKVDPVYSEGVYQGKVIVHNSFDGRELLERKYGETVL
jgi:hypothetical protein